MRPLRLLVGELGLEAGRHLEVKDPCPVHDGERWHLFGTAITGGRRRFEILHATSTSLSGQWRRWPAPLLPALQGSCLAAPGAVHEEPQIHMFLQTDFNRLDGRIEHLVSDDRGLSFQHADTALSSLRDSDEAGIYDAHPTRIGDERYLAYSAFREVGTPDIHLARSAGEGWAGPWERLGPILSHEQVPFHNVRGVEGYEWGLEGAHLLALPGGQVLLTAVCFLPQRPYGSRQRAFLALADDVCGPFTPIGPIMPRHRSGENGHAVTVLDDGELAVILQERDGAQGRWSYATARLPVSALDARGATVAR